MYIVYVHTCRANGKKYVGWTKLSVEERWSEHLADTRRASAKHRLFKQAIAKHGPDEWEHEVLAMCNTVDEARLLEIQWIASLKTNGLRDGHHGYNMTDGGDGRHAPHDELTKHKIANALRGNKCGRGKKGLPCNHVTRSKLSDTIKGRPRARPVEQLGLDGSTKQHASIRDAMRAVLGEAKCSTYANITSAANSTIVKCCNGERDTAYGFRWRWVT